MFDLHAALGGAAGVVSLLAFVPYVTTYGWIAIVLGSAAWLVRKLICKLRRRS